MAMNMMWPDVEPIVTGRCHLEPLTPAHADAMVQVLADPDLYEFTGGTPPMPAQLRRRYRAQSVGHSADDRQWWCNWIVTVLDGTGPVGYVQATVECASGVLEADLAWVMQAAQQGRGLATEAAQAMIDWLARHGVVRFAAYIHPEHAASARVASKLGMHHTCVTHEGEIRWESDQR